VHAGIVSLARMVELLSTNPARILRVPGGRIQAGDAADLTILAPNLAVTVSAASFRSKSRNTPYDGWALRGGVAATLVGGRALFVNPDVPQAAELGRV
jgi:dihydroorotase